MTLLKYGFSAGTVGADVRVGDTVADGDTALDSSDFSYSGNYFKYAAPDGCPTGHCASISGDVFPEGAAGGASFTWSCYDSSMNAGLWLNLGETVPVNCMFYIKDAAGMNCVLALDPSTMTLYWGPIQDIVGSGIHLETSIAKSTWYYISVYRDDPDPETGLSAYGAAMYDSTCSLLETHSSTTANLPDPYGRSYVMFGAIPYGSDADVIECSMTGLTVSSTRLDAPSPPAGPPTASLGGVAGLTATAKQYSETVITMAPGASVVGSTWPGVACATRAGMRINVRGVGQPIGVPQTVSTRI